MDQTETETAEPRSRSHTAASAEEVASGGRLLLGWILIVVAVVLLILGWVGVSANPTVAAQLAYFVSGGLGGLLAGIIGVGLLISDDVRRDRARLGRLEAAVLETRELLAAQSEALRDLAARLEARGPADNGSPSRRSKAGPRQRKD